MEKGGKARERRERGERGEREIERRENELREGGTKTKHNKK